MSSSPRPSSRRTVAKSPEEEVEARRAGAELARLPATIAAFSAARRELDDLPGHWWPYFEAFVEVLRADQKRCSAWFDVLRECFDDCVSGLRETIRRADERSTFESAMAWWSEQSSPLAVWSRNGERVSTAHDYWMPAYLLLQLDVAKGARCLESLPFPYLASILMTVYVADDPDLIQRMIKEVPELITAQWSPADGFVAVMLIEAITQHAEELYRYVPDSLWGLSSEAARAQWRSEARTEAEAWLSLAFGAYARRPDGVEFGCAYLARLHQQNAYPHGGSPDLAVIPELARATPPCVRVVAGWFEQQPSGA